MNAAVNTIPCPRAFAEERPCGEMTHDGRLCSRCTSGLRHTLRDLPALWRDLQVTLTRQDRTEGTTKRSGREEPLPFSLAASWSGDAVIMTVHTWIRDLQETYRIGTDPGTTMTAWCSWLTEQMHHIRNHPAVDQLWDELTEPGRLVKRTIDRPADQTYLCACAICGHPVFGPEGVDEVECRECRKVVGDDGYVPVYVRSEEAQRRKDTLRKEWLTLAETVVAVRFITGWRLNRKTVHSWGSRGRIALRSGPSGEWLYSVDEVICRAEQIPERDRQMEGVA